EAPPSVTITSTLASRAVPIAALILAGMQLDFWRIAMRPGKQLMVGSFGETHVLGLPGNPVSSLVCSLLLLEPLIRKLAS
ncbi:molybdopterin-binding protein, partial [Rhizobium ruizarguesonis]